MFQEQKITTAGEGAKRPEDVEGKKVTHGVKKRSDRDAERAKDHHHGRGSEATGGGVGQKVTHGAKKRNDKNETRAKDHYYEKKKGVLE